MADFCKQCSVDLFGKDFRELAGLSTLADDKNKLYAVVLCEGCGMTVVDSTGTCVNKDCLKHHGTFE